MSVIVFIEGGLGYKGLPGHPGPSTRVGWAILSNSSAHTSIIISS